MSESVKLNHEPMENESIIICFSWYASRFLDCDFIEYAKMKRKNMWSFHEHHSTHSGIWRSFGPRVAMSPAVPVAMSCIPVIASLCHHAIVTVSWGLIAVPDKQNMVVSITMRQYLFWISRDSRCSYLKSLKANLPHEACPKKDRLSWLSLGENTNI